MLESPPFYDVQSLANQDAKMKSPVRVTITGAVGQIGYQLAFSIASGQMLGADQPVILQLLEIPPALPALNGVVMELDDCAFDTLAGVVATDDPNVAFKDSDYALLVGARPRRGCHADGTLLPRAVRQVRTLHAVRLSHGGG